jgi:hypothetical protein
MVRTLAVALFLLASAAPAVAQAPLEVGKELKVEGELKKDDPPDAIRNGPSKVYVVRLKRGTSYTIEMMSGAFDAFLRLQDPKGKQLDEDDDGGGGLNSKIVFNCNADGNYRIVATAFNAGGMGKYTLLVRPSGAAPKVTSSHEQLLNKQAPDFQADFAVNGKAAKLSDFKGKVVLLAFWDVRSAACASTIPKLAAWHKDHQKDGLEVVGVTFYTFEIGDRVGFDKEKGSVTTIDKASKQTEQAMLREYAAFHKVAHPLMTLPKAEALKAFNAYGVNGVPQFVVIDREGVVRGVRVGEKSVDALEPELKKLLAAQ